MNIAPRMSSSAVALRLRASSSSNVNFRVQAVSDASAPVPHVAPGNAPLLEALDEDADLLFLIVSQQCITTWEQCALARTCKLLSLIVREAAHETTYLSSSVTGSVEEARDAVGSNLRSPPTFGLCFANPGPQRKKKLQSLVRSLPPTMHLIGGSVQTLVGTTPEGTLTVSRDTGVALSLGAFPEATVGSFVLDGGDVDLSSTDAIVAQLAASGALEPGAWKVILVVSLAMRHGALNTLLRSLQEANPDAAIIGGLATGSYLVHAFQHRLRILSRGGAVGLLLGGNVPMQAVVCTDAPKQRLATAKRQLVEDEGKALLGGLMFTCTARNERRDAEGFCAAFPGAPLVGMPCGGEIGPESGAHSISSREIGGASQGGGGSVTQTGNVALQGFTAVYGLFAAPVRRRIAAPYWDDVPGAYASMRQDPTTLAAMAAATTAAAVQAAEQEEQEKEEEEEDDDAYEMYDSDEEDDEEYDSDDDDLHDYDDYDGLMGGSDSGEDALYGGGRDELSGED